jgi:hypothetical protein
LTRSLVQNRALYSPRKIDTPTGNRYAPRLTGGAAILKPKLHRLAPPKTAASPRAKPPRPQPSPKRAARQPFGERVGSKAEAETACSSSAVSSSNSSHSVAATRSPTPVERDDMAAVCTWLATLSSPYVDRRASPEMEQMDPPSATMNDAASSGGSAVPSAVAQRVVRARAIVNFERDMTAALRVSDAATPTTKAFHTAVEYLFNGSVAAARSAETLRVRHRRQLIMDEHDKVMRAQRKPRGVSPPSRAAEVAPGELFHGDTAREWCDEKPDADESEINIFRRLTAPDKVDLSVPRGTLRRY